MDALQLCAQKYAALCEYTYDCTFGRKGQAFSLQFAFSSYEFLHLSGLHYLVHPRLTTNAERVLKDILSGKITMATLHEAPNWGEKKELILSRIEALSNLETLMDEFQLFYGFSQKALLSAKPSIKTSICADYLIKFQPADDITFFFTIRYKNTYRGCSLFVNNIQDYSKNQTAFTLLEKKKTHRKSGDTKLLFQRESYKPDLH